MTSPVLALALVVVTASLMALAGLDPAPEATADAGLARVGGDLALVIVAERPTGVEGLPSLLVGWGLVAPLALAVAGLWLAWWVSGRVKRTIDDSRAAILSAAGARHDQLQEVVHELRTPLAVMGTNLELASIETETPGGYIQAALRAVGRMSRTVDDLEGHGRLNVEAGHGPVDLAALAEALVEESRGPGRAGGIRVTNTGRLGSLIVDGVDPAALRTATGNFMSNAMRMAPRGSEVVVDFGELHGWAWLSVSDQGAGLAPKDHARAFERGWQGAHDRDRQEGSGLGLTIARQLTEAQSGLVTVVSEEGGGATFTMWLPIDPYADPDTILAADRIHPMVEPWATAVPLPVE